MQRLEERLNDSQDPGRCILPFPDPTMAGEQSEDQSFYDLLVEDPELPLGQTIVLSPLGHSQHQQPISSPNRTSRDTPQPPDLTEMETHQQPHHPVPADPMSIAWGLSGVDDQNPQLHPALFNFIVPGTMIPAPDNTSRHHSHLPQAYSSEFVTLSSIQSCGHYDSGFPGHWDGTLNHGTSTPRVAIPIGQATNNPRAELDVAPQDNSPTPASQPKRTPRTRRKKKEAHNTSEVSQGDNSSADAGAPSLSDVASPSPASHNSHTSISSKPTSMEPTTSIISNCQRQLRIASRISKNTRSQLNGAPEERRARASHNRVEKHYRNRLNAQFESLLNALLAKVRQGDISNGDDNEWDGTSDLDRRVSKGEVLEMARKCIQGLERESNELQRENFELKGSLQRLKGSASDGTVSSSEPEAPFNFN
ncbi:uncharacterized protein FOBCDRAFT_321376 [Fusarium oxysporum Fo47]|uniref:uncharacterized protein n=1 Tax=Fusarium oxysporum Fo47 TaxID=660027 RepID=UPI001597F9A8|nr:uncharacterized protein FOBCDRAFT_321376 [Fusarium oxysporum Fo47]QKD57183.1 hypothetical protein FOBCDRAFT_321376 [Fusarium oxysporum Fo47]